MKDNATVQNIINIIADHYINSGSSRLTINEVSKRANISRQSFNRYYNELKPYVLGKKPIGELIKSESSVNLLIEAQKRITQLDAIVTSSEERHKKELQDVRLRYLTTLMNNDIALHESDEIRKEVQKMVLLNDDLNSKIKILNQQLTLAVTQNKKEIANDSGDTVLRGDHYIYEPDLRSCFLAYAETKNVDLFEKEKNEELNKLIYKLNKFRNLDNVEIVVFIERYISSFKRFIENYECKGCRVYIFIRLPLMNRTDLRLFISQISICSLKTAYLPWSESEPVIKAQRTFMFRNVPDYELLAADEYLMPTIADGFDRVIICKIVQGD